jgi:hypothetical protein
MKRSNWVPVAQPWGLNLIREDFPFVWVPLGKNHPMWSMGCSFYLDTQDGNRRFILHATGMMAELERGEFGWMGCVEFVS